MIWEYLSGGGYLHPLFANWFSSTYLTIYRAMFIFNAVCLFLIPLIISKVLSNREVHNSNFNSSRYKAIRIQFHTVLRLIKSSESVGFFRAITTFVVLLFTYGYGEYYAQIIADPHVLTTGGIQELSAEDVKLLIDFLYRFAFLGGFLILISTAVSFGFFTSILSDHDAS